MTTVLVADNKESALNFLSQEVSRGGYSVVRATNPEQALAALNSGRVDLGVLDLKLRDDTEFDFSGIRVAMDADRAIPKIIVSDYDSFAAAREALGTKLDGLSAAVDYIKKDNASTDLLPAIERALKIKHLWSATARNRISTQLNEDYIRARRDAVMHYWTSLLISIAFALPIIIGAFQLHGGTSITLVFTVVGVVVAEVTNYIFARKLEFLSHRVDRFHSELLQAYRFEQLLEASDYIRNEGERERYKLHVLETATARWVGSAVDEAEGQTRSREVAESSRQSAGHGPNSLLPPNVTRDEARLPAANLPA
jgi:CheY-like chemotaxis protein